MEFFDKDVTNDSKVVATIMSGLVAMTAILCYAWVLTD